MKWIDMRFANGRTDDLRTQHFGNAFRLVIIELLVISSQNFQRNIEVYLKTESFLITATYHNLKKVRLVYLEQGGWGADRKLRRWCWWWWQRQSAEKCKMAGWWRVLFHGIAPKLVHSLADMAIWIASTTCNNISISIIKKRIEIYVMCNDLCNDQHVIY